MQRKESGETRSLFMLSIYPIDPLLSLPEKTMTEQKKTIGADFNLETKLQMAMVMLESGTTEQWLQARDLMRELFPQIQETMKNVPMANSVMRVVQSIREESKKHTVIPNAMELSVEARVHRLPLLARGELTGKALNLIDELKKTQPATEFLWALATELPRQLHKWCDEAGVPSTVELSDAQVFECVAFQAAAIRRKEEELQRMYDEYPEGEAAAALLATHKHYKGGYYRRVGVIRDADDGRTRTHYRHIWPHDRGAWVRDLEEYDGNLEDGTRRFTPINE